MAKKNVLLIDDEPLFLEALADALEYEGVNVLKAKTAAEGIKLLQNNKIDLVTIDIMIDPGEGLRGKVDSHNAGLYVCEYVHKHHKDIDAFSISVVSDMETINKIQSFGVKFLRKGETPLRTVLNMLRSRLTGFAYSSERDSKTRKKE